MLVKNKKEYCWIFDGDAGNPQSNIEGDMDTELI